MLRTVCVSFEKSYKFEPERISCHTVTIKNLLKNYNNNKNETNKTNELFFWRIIRHFQHVEGSTEQTMEKSQFKK